MGRNNAPSNLVATQLPFLTVMKTREDVIACHLIKALCQAMISRKLHETQSKNRRILVTHGSEIGPGTIATSTFFHADKGDILITMNTFYKIPSVVMWRELQESLWVLKLSEWKKVPLEGQLIMPGGQSVWLGSGALEEICKERWKTHVWLTSVTMELVTTWKWS